MLGNYAKVRGIMTLDYREEIRQDIAHEFGLEAGGYAPRKGPELPAPVISPVRKVVWAKTDELIKQITNLLERIAA